MLERVLDYFEEISQIPRGSGNTKAISDYCVQFAKLHNLQFYQDDHNNVVIYKKGTSNTEPLILQGHLDMVCEKNPDTIHDFTKDPLKLIRDEKFIRAEGTTLGGDDGIAVAMCLAILESNDIKHPDLEVVFTTDEETGMFGAHALDVSRLKGHRLLNIDSEVENVLTVGCAGGARVEINMPLEFKLVPNSDEDFDCYKVTVTGLIGGHSGIEIDKGRLNSNIVMGEFLDFLLDNDYNLKLMKIEGGKADNVIPNETVAELYAPYAGDVAPTTNIHLLAKQFTDQFKLSTDPDLAIAIEPIVRPENVLVSMLTSKDTEKVINFLNETPNGIQSMSKDIKGLVETSMNLGQLKTTNNGITVRYSVRSSKTEEKEKQIERLIKLAENYNATATADGHYPAWEYNKNSAFKEKVIEAYRETYKGEPKVEVIHAGLECGIFAEKIKDFDAVSIGPNIFDIHTPKEKLDLESVGRTLKAVIRILETV